MLRYSSHHIINGILLWNIYESVILRFFEKKDTNKFVTGLQEKISKGHFAGETTTPQDPKGNLLLAKCFQRCPCL
jgi:hypothetical protein